MNQPAETHSEKHPKQDFQVERLAFFSDAVFAIAITLLIIEFKVPHVTKDSTYADVWQQVLALKYQFAALLLSFWLIATYWIRHHLLFKHIHNYNRSIIVMSMLVLLPIIFFPFTTSFLAESVENKAVAGIAFRLFLLNHILAGVFMAALYWLAFIRHPDFSYEMPLVEKREFISKTIFTTLMFIVFFAMSFFRLNENFIIAVVLLLAVVRRFYLRRSTGCRPRNDGIR